jgi:mutator protein MutT
MKHLDVAVAIVFRDSKVLITRRKPGGILGGLWEFPGGKQEPGESLEDCVRRELSEELAMRVQPVVSLTPIVHQYPDREVCLHPFLCTHESGEPQLIGCADLQWVTPAQLRSFEFPEANRHLITELINALPNPPFSVTVPIPAAPHKKKRRQPALLDS